MVAEEGRRAGRMEDEMAAAAAVCAAGSAAVGKVEVATAEAARRAVQTVGDTAVAVMAAAPVVGRKEGSPAAALEVASGAAEMVAMEETTGVAMAVGAMAEALAACAVVAQWAARMVVVILAGLAAAPMVGVPVGSQEAETKAGATKAAVTEVQAVATTAAVATTVVWGAAKVAAGYREVMAATRGAAGLAASQVVVWERAGTTVAGLAAALPAAPQVEVARSEDMAAAMGAAVAVGIAVAAVVHQGGQASMSCGEMGTKALRPTIEGRKGKYRQMVTRAAHRSSLLEAART